MKIFYSTWNRDNVTEEAIADNLKQLSGGKLTVDIEEVKATNGFDLIYKDNNNNQNNNNKSQRSHSNNKGKRNNNHKRRRN